MAGITLFDDLNRPITVARPPLRIVSLVPSDTYTLVQLGLVERLVGRTTYCEEPRGLIESIPTVGGTKDASAQAILDLSPDMVIANQEENTQSTLAELYAAGVPVFVVFPKRVEDGIALIARLARLFGCERESKVRSHVKAAYQSLEAAQNIRKHRTPKRTFCPIWMDPLMTIHGETYISDTLDLAGFSNVFANRPRRYPLAADLGLRAPLPAEKIAGRDTRYPRVTLDEIRTLNPEIVILPDEPHPFSDVDEGVFQDLLPHAKVMKIPGKDVCWYGSWSVDAFARLGALV